MVSKHSIDNAFTATGDYGINSEPTYSGALSFLRRRYSKDLEGIDVAVTGIPLDTATTHRPGTRFGPRALREASTNMSWERPYGWSFSPLDRLAVVDYGDCLWDHGRPETIPEAIESHIAGILEGGALPLSLGGDHFLSFPVVRALAKKHGPLSLIHFDAHSDTWNDEDGEGRVDHGTMFYHAAKEGIVVPEESVQIGLRTHNDDTLGFNVLDAPWVHRHGVDAVVDEVKAKVGKRPVYMTFDIDCLDPAFAPGTGTPVCGGLTTAMALEIIRGLTGFEYVGMDLVEVAPAYDVGNITGMAGASLAYQWLAVVAAARE